MCRSPPPLNQHPTLLLSVTRTLPGRSVRPDIQASAVETASRPPPPPEEATQPSSTALPFNTDCLPELRYWALPAARKPPIFIRHNIHSTQHLQQTFIHIFLRYTQFLESDTNRHWKRLGAYEDIETLLLIAGIEINPGPLSHNHQRQNFTIAHININSITAENKIDELQQFTERNNVKILAASETKLDDKIAKSLYTLEGFHTPLTRHRDRHGGGVAIYVHKSLPYQRLTQLEVGNEEWIWSKIKTKQFTLLICCVYLPPNLTAERLHDFNDHFTESVCLAQSHSPTATLLLGDLNTGNIYLDESTYNHNGITSFDRLLQDTADTLDLQQLITQPTRITDNRENLRDLIFTSNNDIIIDSGTLSPFSQLDHFPIYATINVTPPPEIVRQAEVDIWDYSNLNASLLTTLLLDTDWTNILTHDVDEATNLFISAILDAATSSIPIKRKQHRTDQKPWITSELKRNIRKRDRLFKIAKHKQDDFSWSRWRYQRNYVTAMNRKMKSEHFQRQVQLLLSQKHNPYKYHKTLRTITGRKRDDTIPPLQVDNGDIITDDIEKATLLNNHFTAQSTLNIPPTQSPPTNDANNAAPVPTLENITITEQEVLRTLNSLDPNKSTGPDGIPVKLLKLIALLISEPLAKLFNKSLAVGIFPDKFKEADVKPILKNKGLPSDYSCYRPISILSALSKVFEKIVYKHVYNHFTEHSLLSDKQSGYRQSHSTQQQLLYLTHNLYKSLDSGHDFTAIYLDISKYFDKIWHKGLLHKCKNDFGITGRLLDWLSSYLKDRRQRVRINNSFSTTLKTNAGCPQGSVLGPLLALIYLDGLSKRTKNDILFFADDTSLYSSHSTHDLLTTERSLQIDLNEIHKYGQEWAIKFNTTKTIQQTFSHKREHQTPTLYFGGDKIPVHKNHTHLGMTFSEDLRFHEHINKICHKINIALSPLYPIAKYLPRPILDQIYKTYIRPHFDYCDIIYDGHITIQDVTRLETLQNRAGRLVTGGLFRTPTDKLRAELGWDRLTVRRHIHRLTMYHRLNNPTYHSPDYIISIMPNTRSHDTNLMLRNANTHTSLTFRTTSYKRSFFPTTGAQWNTLTDTTRRLSHHTFRKQLHEQLGQPDPSKFYAVGTKKGNILHARLRMDMTELNSHLFTIQKTSSPVCRCGHHLENIYHFVFSCPNYVQQRTLLYSKVSSIITNFTSKPAAAKLQILLHGAGLSGDDGRAVAFHFQNFLLNSGRFTRPC